MSLSTFKTHILSYYFVHVDLYCHTQKLNFALLSGAHNLQCSMAFMKIVLALLHELLTSALTKKKKKKLKKKKDCTPQRFTAIRFYFKKCIFIYNLMC